MKKAFIVILVLLCTSMLVIEIQENSNSTEKNSLAGSSWHFKTAVSKNTSTMDYLSTIYGKASYNFSNDHTYTGTFFELAISGTWEVSENTLILNKGKSSEEVYGFVLSSNGNLILQTTEKGDSAFIEFVRG